MGKQVPLHIKYFNKYDYLIIAIIASLAYGEYEALGAFTPIRLIGFISLFYSFRNWKSLTIGAFSGWVNFFCFWWLCMTASILWTPDRLSGIIYWFHFTCIIGAIFSLFLLSQKSNNTLAAFSVGWMLFLIITIPIAIWEITSGSHLSSGSFNEGAVVGGVWKKFAAVTFANFNSYSLMLTYSLPFLTLLLWNKSIPYRYLIKILLITIIVATTAILLINSSRAAFLCLLVAIVAMLLFRFKYFNVFQRLLLMVIAFIAVYFLVNNFATISVFSQLAYRFEGGVSSFMDGNRKELIKVGLNIANDNLYFGGGIMSMIPLYSKYHANYNYAHNLIIEILVEHGALICILFLGILLKTYKKLYKIKDVNYKYLFFYILFTMPLMIVIDDSYFGRSGFWIYLATIVSISNIPRTQLKKYQHNG